MIKKLKKKVYNCIKKHYMAGHQDIADILKIHIADVIDACDEMEAGGIIIGDAWRMEYYYSNIPDYYNNYKEPDWSKNEGKI